MKGLERLNVVRKLSQNKPGWIHRDIFRILHKEDIWLLAYENIKGTKETLDGTSIGKLRQLQQKVLDESYQFKPVKPKANGKMRPLGDDKIVQEVIRLVLEAIYEPIFDNRSFGFRSGMGVHDALKYVEKEFRWMDWVMKGEIENAYPTLDYSILRNFLGQKIDDSRFLRLINKSLKCEIYRNPETFYSKLGVPHKSIVSPILANIYFHELDQWITQKGIEYSREHPRYKQLEHQISKVNKELDKTEQNFEQNQTPSLLDPGIKIRYVRYADDWMIGIKGPIQLAKQLKDETDKFFQNHLRQELDPDKTKIINLRAGKASFLGYNIFLPRNMKLVKYKKKGGRQTIPILRFQLPLKTILQRLNERGYITYKDNKWRPISKSGYTPLEDEIIVRHFQSVWRGLLNFYSGTTIWSDLQYIHYLLHMSCAMTLAHRHRSSSSKIFKKYGKRLEIKDQIVIAAAITASFPYRTSWKASDRKWQTARHFRDPFTIYANRGLK